MSKSKLGAKVFEALKLLTTEQADALIGEAPEQHGILIAAVQEEMGLLYALLCKRAGLRNNKRNQRLMSQAQLVLMQLVHFAFALGVSHAGKGDAAEGDDQP